MGASTLQAAVSRRVHATGPEVAAATSSADATLAEAAFILDHDDDRDGCRAATAARVLIAEELAALVHRLMPVRIRLAGAVG